MQEKIYWGTCGYCSTESNWERFGEPEPIVQLTKFGPAYWQAACGTCHDEFKFKAN